MFKVGLTGGIGVGKSTACDIFKSLNIDVIDSDQIAHSLLEPNTKYYYKVVSYFGEKILKHDQIQRNTLRDIVFSDNTKKKWLESLLHPPIIEELKSKSTQSKSPYSILAIPLLFEAKLQYLVDRILIIKSSKKNRLERLKKIKIDQNVFLKIAKNQLDDDAKSSLADDIIENDNDITSLKEKILSIHKKYLTLAK